MLHSLADTHGSRHQFVWSTTEPPETTRKPFPPVPGCRGSPGDCQASSFSSWPISNHRHRSRNLSIVRSPSPGSNTNTRHSARPHFPRGKAIVESSKACTVPTARENETEGKPMAGGCLRRCFPPAPVSTLWINALQVSHSSNGDTLRETRRLPISIMKSNRE